MGNGIERFENITLTVENSAAKVESKIMLLDQLQERSSCGWPSPDFHPEALRDAIFDLIGIGARRRIKADELGKIVDTGDIAISSSGARSYVCSACEVGLSNERGRRNVQRPAGEGRTELAVRLRMRDWELTHRWSERCSVIGCEKSR